MTITFGLLCLYLTGHIDHFGFAFVVVLIDTVIIVPLFAFDLAKVWWA